MKKASLAMVLLLVSSSALAVDNGALIGAAAGAAAGAAIGNSANGQNGAILGAALGAAAGAALGSNDQPPRPAVQVEAPEHHPVADEERVRYHEHEDNGHHWGQRKRDRED